MAIVKTFEQELKELLSRYNASIIFEYDTDYKYSSAKVINDIKEVLFEVPNSNSNSIIIGSMNNNESLQAFKTDHDFIEEFSRKLLSNMKDTPPEFAQILADNFWELV